MFNYRKAKILVFVAASMLLAPATAANDPSFFLKEGQQWERDNSPKNAQQCFINGLRNDPENATLQECLLRVCQSEADKNSSKPDSHIDLGNAYAYCGQIDKAQAEFKKAMQCSPEGKNSEARRLLRLSNTPSLKQNPNSKSAADWLKIEPEHFDMGPYMVPYLRKIKHEWLPPASHEDDVVGVTFTISSDGTIKNLKVSKSSGYEESDKAALKAVEAAAPFARLPDDADDSVDIQYYFSNRKKVDGPQKSRPF